VLKFVFVNIKACLLTINYNLGHLIKENKFNVGIKIQITILRKYFICH
jgi:hypothetical protein